MTEMHQVEHGPGKYQADSGGYSIRGLGQHTGLIGAMCIIAGAQLSLAMAFTRVRRLSLWLLPTVLCTTGIALVAMPLVERKA